MGYALKELTNQEWSDLERIDNILGESTPDLSVWRDDFRRSMRAWKKMKRFLRYCRQSLEFR